jgi:hypothetical protein
MIWPVGLESRFSMSTEERLVNPDGGHAQDVSYSVTPTY